MAHLCIATFVKVMTSCAIQAERRYSSFCEKIMIALCPSHSEVFSYTLADGNEVTYSDTNFTKIYAAKQNLPKEVMQIALKKNPNDIEKYFIKEIIPLMEEGRKKNAVLALKYIILNDKTIADTAQLGTIVNMTKNDLKEKKEFVLSEFLTDIFIYAIAKTDNKCEVEFTKSIKKNYYAAFDKMTESVKLYELEKRVVNPILELTSFEKGFSDIFIPVECARLNTKSEHDLQFFCLKFEDTDFDYKGLWQYLVKNIGNYVYSRAQMERYKDPEIMATLAYDAIQYVKMLIDDSKIPTGHELGEMLLYLFLEQVLKATKFMSRIEIIGSNGVYSSESSGIFIWTDKSEVSTSKIILGTSTIVGNLNNAIDEVFYKIQELEKRKKKERNFVESNIFAQSFTPKVSKQLADIIIPKENGKNKPNTAFGIFLGYSLSDVSAKGQSIEGYQKAVMNQLKKDIVTSATYIESILTEQLKKYSIYIYVLPFSNAEEDQKEIMDKLLQRGGGSI